MTIAATAGTCARCHPESEGYNSSHRDGLIRLSGNINASIQTTLYNNSSTPFPQRSNPEFGSCTNINCHFETTTPVWGSEPIIIPTGCAICHGAPPANGNHPAVSGPGKRHGDYYGTGLSSCSRCHSSHVSPSFAHATSAGKRPLDLSFTTFPNTGGIYSGNIAYPDYLPSQSPARNGSCSGTYCHSDGKGGAPAEIPVWGGTISSCTGCHGTGGASSTLSGRHGAHTDPARYGFSCVRCHLETVSDSVTVTDRSKHLNRVKDVVFQQGGSYNSGSLDCNNSYCHSDGASGPPGQAVVWSDTAITMTCYSCHKGRASDNTQVNCATSGGNWDADKQLCSPYLNISTNGHSRLTGPQWIRKYPCTYCHNATITAVTDANGLITGDGDLVKSNHLNGTKDVVIAAQWALFGNRSAPLYNVASKTCANIYCHSDGTAEPEQVRNFAWNMKKTACNSCHGHPVGSCGTSGCHDGISLVNGRTLAVYSGWSAGQEWKSSMPMYANVGAGTGRANSHIRHLQTNFTCDECHFATIRNGVCTDCHGTLLPPGTMDEVAHINPDFHVNKTKDVVFKGNNGTYDQEQKTCSNTRCHTGGTDPRWGESVKNAIICSSCHGTTGPDVDDFGTFNGVQAKISMSEWMVSGHGRPAAAGNYPVSGNPPANFPGNPCWYCHDNTVLHKDTKNPFRLRQHNQFSKRFDKECVYCHMEGVDSECLGCHNSIGSLAPQLATITSPVNHSGFSGECTASCHADDAHRHKTGAGSWNALQKADIRNSYIMMGVCLKCHDDDSGGKCTSCHTAPVNNPDKYSLGFDGGSGFVKPEKARASSVHFGYKHWRAQQNMSGSWKGGKFCWDCHDPHGDKNIFMIQDKVATETDGTYGIPVEGKTREVIFTNKLSGQDYATKDAPFNKICNVCHSETGKHYRFNGGDGHNASRVCTTCHEHRFTDSHANRQSCNSCHLNKPVPRHSAFGLPRDCTKCHAGTIGNRMDVMGQMKANSHHVQGVEVKGTHCYACHWEATDKGLINLTYHNGFNHKTYSSAKNAVVDLVLWGPGFRPTTYRQISSAAGRATVQSYLASNIGTGNERAEVAKLTNVCLACHSDQNNDTQPFGDCKTPRQYAWDGLSIAARYAQTGTTPWGKYNSTTYTGANKKDMLSKAFSAHGNAVSNAGGGWDATPGGSGQDGVLTNTRGGSQNVQCYDCHSSHGSKVVGTTTSYVTFNGTRNGGNLKETQKGKGGYNTTYKASFSNVTGIGRYSAGAGQCFDCHENANAQPNTGTPWGYQSTFGATQPIMGYKDTLRFGQGIKGSTQRFNYRDSRKSIKGSHMRASSELTKETGVATGGTETTITAAKTWTTDSWVEFSLQMTSGANSGQLRQIIGNSATTLTVEPFPLPVAVGDSFKIVSFSSPVNGLCTPCHDPHGVSPTLGADQAYAVPLLKGTWLTSPYKEDAPPPDPYGNNISTDANGRPKSWGQYRAAPYPTQPVTNHNIDRNLFGDSTRISENDQKFAGLCLGCHNKSLLTDSNSNESSSWKSSKRIHKAVKGWGSNKEHSYPCAKCHQPHNSGLPRLLQTNCLNDNHRGQRASSGAGWSADRQQPGSAHGSGGQHRGYPVGNIYSNTTEATTACHVSRFSPTYNSGAPPSQWPNENLWNSVTPW